MSSSSEESGEKNPLIKEVRKSLKFSKKASLQEKAKKSLYSDNYSCSILSELRSVTWLKMPTALCMSTSGMKFNEWLKSTLRTLNNNGNVSKLQS
jgi:hypothetical protein